MSEAPLRYALSFYGLVDLVAVIPTYLSLLIAGTQSLLVVRALRLLRIFRVLKLAQYLGEANVLMTALRASRAKMTVFLGAVLTIVLIMGAAMYLIEGEEHGFTSIPTSMYWAIVTMTTVGYGDITPTTAIGPDPLGDVDDLGLRYYRRADWDRVSRAGARPQNSQHSGLPLLCRRGTRL